MARVSYLYVSPWKYAGSGSDSQGGKVLPWRRELRYKIFFSLVGIWRTCRGILSLFSTMLTLSVMRPGVLRLSAFRINSSHFLFMRFLSTGLVDCWRLSCRALPPQWRGQEPLDRSRMRPAFRAPVTPHVIRWRISPRREIRVNSVT